jgi:hypothetical protein
MADTNLLGNLLVKVKGDISDLEKALKKAEGETKKSSEKQLGFFKKQFKEIDGILGGLPSKMIKLFTNPLVLATTAIIGMTKGLTDGTKEFVDYGSAIYDTAQKTNLSTKSIQEWKYIAEQSGSTLESVTTAVAAMTRGLDTNAKSFELIGVSTKNADGSFRSVNDIFNDTINSLASMTNETQRDNLAFTLLGRSAQGLVPLLNAGADGLDSMRRQASNLGIILEKDTVTNAKHLGDALYDLRNSVGSARNELVNVMAPALITIANGFKSMIQNMLNAKKEIDAFREATSGQITDLDKNSLALARLTKIQNELKNALINIKQARLSQEDEAKAAEQLKQKIIDNERLERQLRSQRNELILIEKQKLKEAGATERQAKAAAEKAAADAKTSAAAKIIQEAEEKRISALDRIGDLEKENTRVMRSEAGKQARIIAEQERDRLAIIKSFEEASISSFQLETARIEARKNAFIAAGVNEVAAETLATQQKVELITGYTTSTNLNIELMRVAYQGLGDTFRSVFDQLGQDIANGELSWKSLGTAAIRSIGNIVSAIGDELAAKAAATLIEAIAASTNPFTAWAAPGLYKSAATLGVGAAAAYTTGGILKATTLAKGGQISDPTFAVVGDNPRYDEVVAPLSPEVFAGIADGIINALASRARPAGVTPATAGSFATLTSTSGSKVVNINIGQFIGDDAGIRKFARELRPYLQQESVRVGG